MNKNSTLFPFLLFFLFLLTPAFAFETSTRLHIQSGAKKIPIEIAVADTEETRAKGLMHVTDLNDSQGMLFIYAKERSDIVFWMHNTPTSLDILFISKDFEIHSIVENTTPYSTKRIYSAYPFQYALEVKAGFVKKHGIKEGDRLVLQQSNDGKKPTQPHKKQSPNAQ